VPFFGPLNLMAGSLRSPATLPPHDGESILRQLWSRYLNDKGDPAPL
jgi:hypothetical protein